MAILNRFSAILLRFHSFLCILLRNFLCVLSLALNLSKNSCVFPFFDQGIGRSTVPKLMNNGPKSAHLRQFGTKGDQSTTNSD